MKHHTVSVENRTLNGLIEGLVRTIKNGMMKNGNAYPEDILENVISAQNNSLYMGLNMSIIEAIEKTTETMVNSIGYREYSYILKKRIPISKG